MPIGIVIVVVRLICTCIMYIPQKHQRSSTTPITGNICHMYKDQGQQHMYGSSTMLVNAISYTNASIERQIKQHVLASSWCCCTHVCRPINEYLHGKVTGSHSCSTWCAFTNQGKFQYCGSIVIGGCVYTHVTHTHAHTATYLQLVHVHRTRRCKL